MLTIQFIRYDQIEDLNSDDRVKKVLEFVKNEKIVLIEGKLKPSEEANLIAKTMAEIDEEFTGIELDYLNSSSKEGVGLFRKVKSYLASALLGNRQGFTIIGPASVVKEIKKDPDNIQLKTQLKGER